MTHFLYQCLWLLLMPVVLLRLLWRSWKNPAQGKHVGERYGFYRHLSPPSSPVIWLHAVSLGEMRASQPLCAALAARYPQHCLLLTTMTLTGRRAAEQMVAQLNLPARVVYLPYDLSGAVQRFLRFFQPEIGLLLETEIWPNLITQCAKQNIPLLLLNARLSARSLQRYQRFPSLWRNLFHPAWAALTHVAAQTAEDAERIQQVGAQQVSVCGTIKFDVSPNPEQIKLGHQWRAHWQQSFPAGTAMPIWITASTREGEEVIILEIFRRLTQITGLEQSRLLLVPRHPERFADIASMLENSAFTWSRRSVELPNAQIWLGDSMGEMPAYFATADLALMGGSLLAYGGQNLIEAMACGCPVIMGPSSFNFAEATRLAIAAGAAAQITAESLKESQNARSAEQAEHSQLVRALTAQLSQILLDPARRASMQQNAIHFTEQHRGAVQRMLPIIENYLP